MSENAPQVMGALDCRGKIQIQIWFPPPGKCPGGISRVQTSLSLLPHLVSTNPTFLQGQGQEGE